MVNDKDKNKVSTKEDLKKILKLKKFKEFRIKKKRFLRLPLYGSPMRKGFCVQVKFHSPKKPNSANRRCVQLCLKSTGFLIYCHLPGERNVSNIKKHSNLLAISYRVRDLPQVNYRGVRGYLDLQSVSRRRTSRSKYGQKRVK